MVYQSDTLPPAPRQKHPGHLVTCLMLLLVALQARAQTGAELYDVYTRPSDLEGIPEIMIVSREPLTGRKLVVPVGSDIQTPIVFDEYRRAIRIHPLSPSEETITVVHPSAASEAEGWSLGGLTAVFGDITGDGRQDMLVIGADGAKSYTLSWDRKKDQLVIQQALDNEAMKFYIERDYDITLEDMNGDQMDDLVFRKEGEIVDIALVTGQGVFFADDTTREAAEVTAGIMVDSLIRAAKESDIDAVMALAGRKAVPMLENIREAIGDEALLEELASVESVVPAKVGVNFAQYELGVRTEDGELEFFPLMMERSRNGLWKIERL